MHKVYRNTRGVHLKGSDLVHAGHNWAAKDPSLSKNIAAAAPYNKKGLIFGKEIAQDLIRSKIGTLLVRLSM